MADRPTTTITVPQDFLIESLNGPRHPKKFLDRFPDELYDKSVNSVLIKFLYALLGPSGAGWIQKNYMDVRVIFEENGIQLDQLEKFYGNPLRFGRNLEEIYDDELTGLLPRDNATAINAKDAAYRNRVIDFLHAARLGGTVEGMALAAKSATGSSVEIIENYQYMFDQHSDEVLSLEHVGNVPSSYVDNTGEFVVLPNTEFSRTIVQTIKFDNKTPVSGNFVLTFQGQKTDSSAQSISGGTVTQSGNTVTGVGTSFNSRMVNGTITIGASSAKIGLGIDTANQTMRVSTTASISATSDYTIVYGGLTSSATSFDVMTALCNLPNIGWGNVSVTGDIANGFKITFTNALSNIITDTIVVESSLLDAVGNKINATVSVDFINQTASEVANISSKEQHLMESALDKIKPVNTYATYKPNQGSFYNHVANAPFASSQYYEIIRYVTGSNAVQWPSVDSVYWIEKGIEKEAPRIYGDLQQHYRAFHEPAATYAYSEDAKDETVSEILNQRKYISEYQGAFNPNFLKAFNQKFLDPKSGSETRYAKNGLANFAEPPTITSQSDYSGTPMVNGIYPVGDKLQPILQNLLSYKDKTYFWASEKREPTKSDYFEIDLGEPKAVNFLLFDVCRLPIDIEISYDKISDGVNRSFVTVTPESLYPFHTSIYYEIQKTGTPWESLSYHFTDYAENIIFTRYLRIKFTRRDEQFMPSADEPWPILMKNLRIGRNI
jgi:hypothetical protein